MKELVQGIFILGLPFWYERLFAKQRLRALRIDRHVLFALFWSITTVTAVLFYGFSFGALFPLMLSLILHALLMHLRGQPTPELSALPSKLLWSEYGDRISSNLSPWQDVPPMLNATPAKCIMAYLLENHVVHILLDADGYQRLPDDLLSVIESEMNREYIGTCPGGILRTALHTLEALGLVQSIPVRIRHKSGSWALQLYLTAYGKQVASDDKLSPKFEEIARAYKANSPFDAILESRKEFAYANSNDNQ